MTTITATTMTATNLLTVQSPVKLEQEALVQSLVKNDLLINTPEINLSLTSGLSENEIRRVELQLKFALQQHSPQELNDL
jgi:hypothetical protein